jgi:hypothetical protein
MQLLLQLSFAKRRLAFVSRGSKRERHLRKGKAMDHKAARFSVHLLAVLALLLSCSVGAADPDKVLRIAQIDIDTLDPHQWTDTFSNRVGSGMSGSLRVGLSGPPDQARAQHRCGIAEITDGGKKWIIRVTPGIFFTDDPVFNGSRASSLPKTMFIPSSACLTPISAAEAR